MKVTLEHPPRPLRQASHSNVVTSVAFAPDGETLASGSWDGTIKLWDLRDGKFKLKRTLRGDWDEVEAVAYAPDGGALAGLGTGWDGAPYGAVMVWNQQADKRRPLIRVGGKLDAIAFTPDGSTLATASADGRVVTLWNALTGQEQVALPDHRDAVWSLAISPDGTRLAAASGMMPAAAERKDLHQVGAIRLWSLDNNRPTPLLDLVGHEHGIISVAFAPDGTTLASGGFDRCVRLWDTDSGRERATLEGHEGWVAAVAFSPDGALLASGSHDHTIRLWEAPTGRELATLEGHTGNVYTVAFSPDGTLLASGSLDGSVRLWDVADVLNRGGGA